MGEEIFISYSREDSGLMRRLYKDLEAAEFDVWADDEIDQNSDDWQKIIQEEIETAGAVVVLLSPDAKESEFVTIEINYALMQGVTVFPVVTRGADANAIPFRLASYNYIDLRGNLYSVNFPELVSTLAKHFGRDYAVVQSPAAPPRRTPVIAVMGTRGGAGKGTFVAGAAQMIAEAGYNVAVIDYDLEGQGFTLDFSRDRPRQAVKTVYDYFAPHAASFENHHVPPDDDLWDITLDYLRKRQLGTIWLMPAAPPSALGTFQVIANIPHDQRNRILFDVTRQIIQRAGKFHIQCILFDCGAGRNPLFSSAFAGADYRYIITNPDAAFFGVIQQLHRQYQDEYPPNEFTEARQDNLFTIVNKVTSERDIQRAQVLNPIGFIPRDPLLEEAKFEEPIEFDFGYNDVFQGIYDSLFRSLNNDRHLVPGAYVARKNPWLAKLVRDGIARRTLHSKEFTRRILGLRVGAAILVAATIILLLVTTIQYIQNGLPDEATEVQIDILPVALLLSLLGGLAYLWRGEERRRKLLVRLVSLDPAKEQTFFDTLALIEEETPKKNLRWLHQLVKNEEDALRGPMSLSLGSR